MIYFIVLGIIILIPLSEYLIVHSKSLKFVGKKSSWLCAILLAVLSSIRYQNEYSDFWINYRHVISSKNLSWSQCFIGDLKGPTNTILMKCVMSIFNNPQWYFVISAFFIVLGFTFFINNFSPLYYLPIFLFFTGGSYFTSNNITRQFLACTIILFAWKYMINRSFLKYLIILLLAASIHISALFFLPMYFLGNISVKKNTVYIYALVGVVMFVFRFQLIKFLQTFIYSNYDAMDYGMTGSNPIRLVFTVINIFLLIYFISNKSGILQIMQCRFSEPNSIRFFNYICHGIAISVILSIFSVTTFLLVSRISIYWNVCSILCWSYCISFTKGKNKFYMICFVAIVYLVWFSVNNYLGKLCPTPYTPFWMFK